VIGFLFGLACGTALGFFLGCIAAIGANTGREADRLFKDQPEPPDLTVKYAGVDHLYHKIEDRKAAGVRVCSCIGDFRGPHYINPDCPFHGGAA
jgi:ribosomal protein L32